MNPAIPRFSGKIAVTCGTTQGIGLAAARKLAREGAKVIISSRTRDNVEEATTALKDEGLDVTGVVCHVSNPEERSTLIQEARRLGGLDILFVNAGVNPAYMGVMDCSESAWDKAFDVNVKAPFLLTKEALPLMKQRKAGRVIYTSTISCWNSLENLGLYSVSKIALLGLMKMAAIQLAKHNITVNSVAPGTVDTKFAEILTQDRNVTDYILSHTPMRRFGTPEEIANVVAFLASDESSYITGEAIPVVGGISTRL